MAKRWSNDEIAILASHYREDQKLCFEMLKDRSIDSVRHKASQLGIKCDVWSREEIEYLEINYPTVGAVGCRDFISRSLCAIRDKAFRLGIVTRCRNGKSIGSEPILSIHSNLVLANCQRHGVVEHRTRSGRSPRCSICRSEYARTDKVRFLNRQSESRKRIEPLRMYAHRLRVMLRLAMRDKRVGCFRFLPYSTEDLRNHLERIKKSQDNRCPACGVSYDISGFHIDHVIPLATANTNQEILGLFSLENLSLLCGPCNCSKGAKLKLYGV